MKLPGGASVMTVWQLTVMMLSQLRTFLKVLRLVTSYTITNASARRKYTDVRALWNLGPVGRGREREREGGIYM